MYPSRESTSDRVRDHACTTAAATAASRPVPVPVAGGGATDSTCVVGSDVVIEIEWCSVCSMKGLLEGCGRGSRGAWVLQRQE